MTPLIVALVGASVLCLAALHLYIIFEAYYASRYAVNLSLEITMSTFKIGQSAVAVIAPTTDAGDPAKVTVALFTVDPAGRASVTPIDDVSATITALEAGPFVVTASGVNSVGDILSESVDCVVVEPIATKLNLTVGVAA